MPGMVGATGITGCRPVTPVSRTEIPVRTISVNEDCVDDACCVYAGFPDAL